MPIRHKVISAALVVVCFSGAAHAGSAEGGFAMRGLGGASCAALTEALAGQSGPALRDSLGAWITGYISGRNEMEPDTFDIIPLQDPRILAALVEGACRQNPDSAVQITLSAIVQKLAAARAHHDTPLLQLGTPQAPLSIRAEVLSFVQSRLTALALMGPAASPGTFDMATSDALAAFQTGAGIPATGLPDDATLLMLLREE